MPLEAPVTRARGREAVMPGRLPASCRTSPGVPGTAVTRYYLPAKRLTKRRCTGVSPRARVP
jgi:hypothetical protein